MPLIWQDEYNLGIQEIDNQHKDYVKLLNKLYTLVQGGKTGKEVIVVFEDLEKYADIHFKTEEKYFDKFKYKGSEEHKLAHRGFVKEIVSLKKQASKNDSVEFLFQAVDFLEDWLIDHLDILDKKYVTCFKDNGLE